jgi:hypothetical protein
MRQPVQVSNRTRSSPMQVFVDDSGRRGRWSRRAGALLVAGAVFYIGVIVGGLAGPRVGPAVDVPVTGNGVVPGLPAGAATPPGLLTTKASRPSTAVRSRAATASVRTSAARTSAARSTGR